MPYKISCYSKILDHNDFIKKFCNFPNDLFKNNQQVKKYQLEMEEKYFSLHQFNHDFFLIEKNEKILLRTMICETPFLGILYFGLFDMDYTHREIKKVLETFKTIIKDWAKEKNITKIVGPINFSTWLPYRLMASFKDGPLFSFEPDRPLEYSKILSECGFLTNQSFYSKAYDQLENFIDSTREDLIKASHLGFSFEFLEKELKEGELKDLHRLSLAIFGDNYLSSPIDFLTFKTLYSATAKKDDYSLSFFIKSKDGERIGFFICFIEHDYCVLKTIGIDPAYRGMGLSNGSVHLALSIASTKYKIKKVVTAMVKEGAQSESYGKKMNLLWTHRYELKELNF